ncbi:MAG: discoidin domain-containing protein [Archangiaceae bacterium]|nr:discoidin domain-containing protein [Archangiaceae bacterium]
MMRLPLAACCLLSVFASCGPEGLDSDLAADPLGYDEAGVVTACGPKAAATGITASTSDTNLPANAIDGNVATRWSGLGVGAFLTVDLGSVQSLCGVSLQWYRGAERQNRFALSVSSDAVTFQQVLSTTSALSAETQSYPLVARGRYVRITVNGNTQNDWASINEVQVNAAQPPPTPGAPGTYKPSASTTGVRAGTTLTPYNTSGADLVISRDGTVLENLDIYGDIKVRARNVVIRNSRLRGGKAIPSGNTGIVDANSAEVFNLLVEDCTLTPDRPSYYRDGIVGHEYTARRNHIYRTNDGLGIFARPGGSGVANVTAEANYIHTLTYWSWDPVPSHTDGTHNDCVQIQGGANIHLIGNTIKCDQVDGVGSGPSPRGNHAGQGVLVQQNVFPVSNVVIEKNWLDDAGATLKLNNTVGGYASISAVVRDNLFGRNQYDYNVGSQYVIRLYDWSASLIDGVNQPGNTTNRWEDTKALLQVGKTLGIRYDVL